MLFAQDDGLAFPRRLVGAARDGGTAELRAFMHHVLFELVLRARSLDDFKDWDRHDTEDFVHVLSGTMVLYTEFYEPVTLEPGDNIYYDGRMGHACISQGETDAVVLWVSAT